MACAFCVCQPIGLQVNFCYTKIEMAQLAATNGRSGVITESGVATLQPSEGSD